jgi:hypothetical protein
MEVEESSGQGRKGYAWDWWRWSNQDEFFEVS